MNLANDIGTSGRRDVRERFLRWVLQSVWVGSVISVPLLKVPGCMLSYQVFGDGTPIVFIAPPVVGSAVLYYQAAGLCDRYQVILPELRGHGQSSPSDRPLTYPVIADDVLRILDHLNIEKAVIAGYSMGGSAVFEFVKKYPERSLGGLPISGFTEATEARLQAELTAAVALARVKAIRTMAFGLALGNADSLKTFQYLYRIGLRSDPFAVLTMFQYSQTYNSTSDIPHLEVPMCLVFGQNDTRLAHHAKKVKSVLKNGSVVYIPGVRHQMPTKKASELNRVVSLFIRQCSEDGVPTPPTNVNAPEENQTDQYRYSDPQ